MLITFTIAFFLFYFSIGSKITNKKIKKLKQNFDFFTFKVLKKFAFTKNRELFDFYYRNCIKLLLAFFISAILYSFLGGVPKYTPFLVVGTMLLIISFTSTKQYKLDAINGLKRMSFLFVLASIAILSIGIKSPLSFRELFTLFPNIFNQMALSLGITSKLLLITLTGFAVAVIFFDLLLWLVMKTFMSIIFSILKAFAKLSFCLNKRKPMAAAHLLISIIILIIAAFIQN